MRKNSSLASMLPLMTTSGLFKRQRISTSNGKSRIKNPMQHERIGRHSQLDQSSCDEQTALHPVLKAVFEALDLAEVSWCLMRRPSSLSAPRGDVDLLIDPVDNVRTRRIMRKLGFGTLRQWVRP